MKDYPTAPGCARILGDPPGMERGKGKGKYTASGLNERMAIKVIDDRVIKSLKVLDLA